jgi:hypothetical protein
MARGPVEVLFLAFPAAADVDRVVEVLRRPVEAGLLAVVDLVVFRREPDGTLVFDDLEEGAEHAAARALLRIGGDDLLTDLDLEVLASSLADDAQGAAVVVEHVWATEVAAGLRALDAVMTMTVRVPPDEVEAAFASAD